MCWSYIFRTIRTMHSCEFQIEGLECVDILRALRAEAFVASKLSTSLYYLPPAGLVGKWDLTKIRDLNPKP